MIRVNRSITQLILNKFVLATKQATDAEYLNPCYDLLFLQLLFLMKAPHEKQATQQTNLPKCLLPGNRADLYSYLATIHPALPEYPLPSRGVGVVVMFPVAIFNRNQLLQAYG